MVADPEKFVPNVEQAIYQLGMVLGGINRLESHLRNVITRERKDDLDFIATAAQEASRVLGVTIWDEPEVTSAMAAEGSK